MPPSVEQELEGKPGAAAQRDRLADAWILMLATVRAVIAFALGFRPFDDTFITFRYGLQLAAGRGLTYNAGEAVLGTSSPLWAGVVAVFVRLGIPPGFATMATALVCDAISAVLVRRLLARLGYRRCVTLIGATLFLVNFNGLTVARSGMEASAFALAAVSAITLLCTFRPIAASLVVVAAVLLRPEGCLLLLPLVVVLGRSVPQNPRARAGLVVAAALLAAWAGYAHATYGSIVPQSVRAKVLHTRLDPNLHRFSWVNLALFLVVGQFGEGPFRRTWWELWCVWTACAAIALVVWTRRAWRGDRPLARILLGGFPVIYLLALAAGGGLTWFPWYYAPVYPFFGGLAAAGIEELGHRLPQGRWFVSITGSALIAAAVGAGALVKARAPEESFVRAFTTASALVPADASLVAASEIGRLGWCVWPTRVLDLAGLVSPDVATPAGWADRAARIGRVRPDAVVLRRGEGDQLLSELRQQAWFSAGYEVRDLGTVPPVEIALRRDRWHLAGNRAGSCDARDRMVRGSFPGTSLGW